MTIFPEAFSALDVGLVSKARGSGLVEIGIHDLRDWTQDRSRKVDDEPFGGGPGMVMAPGPIVEAVTDLKRDDTKVVAMSAAGERFDDGVATSMARIDHVVLVCGRYEGIDQRAIDMLGARELSLGDFVLTGGEVAATAVCEAVIRKLEGFMGNEGSSVEESFSSGSSGLLEYPQFTRPATFEGIPVPDVLLSGNHAEIEKWRRRAALRRTFERRPDLLERAKLSPEERDLIVEWTKG